VTMILTPSATSLRSSQCVSVVFDRNWKARGNIDANEALVSPCAVEPMKSVKLLLSLRDAQPPLESSKIPLWVLGEKRPGCKYAKDSRVYCCGADERVCSIRFV
jgi:uncharacterized protein (UPF0371 family)